MKNTNPWMNNDPFTPMFDEFIKVTALRSDKTLEQTLKCCVFSDLTGEVLYDGNVQTDRQDIKILCKEKDWKFLESLQTGDKINRLSTKITYSISDVKKEPYFGWVITARGD